MNTLSLFSGYGGLELGLKEVFPDAEPIMFCEIEEQPAKILAKRFPGVPIWRDVHTLDGRMFSEEGLEVDCVMAGFPCQSFSIAGQRKGTDDERGILFWEIIRLVDEIRAAQGWLPWLFLENVRGLLSVGEKRTFGAVLQALAEVGYGNIRNGIVGAYHAGAPHPRERIFMLAHPNIKSESDGS